MKFESDRALTVNILYPAHQAKRDGQWYLFVLLQMFHFCCRTDWKCIKCDVLGKFTNILYIFVLFYQNFNIHILGVCLTEKIHNIDGHECWHYTCLNIHIILIEWITPIWAFSSLKIVTVMWCMPWVFHWAEYRKVKASLKYRETIACTKLTTIKVCGINTTHLKILLALKVLPNTTRI